MRSTPNDSDMKNGMLDDDRNTVRKFGCDGGEKLFPRQKSDIGGARHLAGLGKDRAQILLGFG